MEFSRYRIDDFLTVLGSKDAVPGGGGASALVGALGAALGCMVGNLTVGKKKYADVETDIYLLMHEAENLQKELTKLIQKDADGFAPLSRAYAKDKSDPDYDEVMEQCLRKAAEAPMESVRLSCRMIELHDKADDYDLVVTTGKFNDPDIKTPCIMGISLLTGIGQDKTLQQIVDALK